MTYSPRPDAPPPKMDMYRMAWGDWLILRGQHEGGSWRTDSAGVRKRLRQIREEKPEKERPGRLANMGVVRWTPEVERVVREYNSKVAPLWAEHDSKAAPLRAEHDSKADTLRAEYDSKAAPLWAEYASRLTVLSVDEWEESERAAKGTGGSP